MLDLSVDTLTFTRVVVVLMALSSLAFYGMAFRVPVVSFIGGNAWSNTH